MCLFVVTANDYPLIVCLGEQALSLKTAVPVADANECEAKQGAVGSFLIKTKTCFLFAAPLRTHQLLLQYEGLPAGTFSRDPTRNYNNYTS